MAKKGIEYCCFGRLKADGTYEAGYGKWFSPVVAFNFSPNSNNDRDYGDNIIDDTDNEVTGGTLTVELNWDLDKLFEYVLGHTLNSDDDGVETVYNTEDLSPELGVGAIGKTGTRATGYKWKAKVYRRVIFAEPADDNQTKTNTAQFGHTTLIGEVMPLADGEWKVVETFDTKAEAKEWLATYLGILDPNFLPTTLTNVSIYPTKINSEVCNIEFHCKVNVPESWTVIRTYMKNYTQLDANGDPDGYSLTMNALDTNMSIGNARYVPWYVRFYCEYLDSSGVTHLAKSVMYIFDLGSSTSVEIVSQEYNAGSASISVSVEFNIPSGAVFKEIALLALRATTPTSPKRDTASTVNFINGNRLNGVTSYQFNTNVNAANLTGKIYLCGYMRYEDENQLEIEMYGKTIEASL